MISKGVWAVAMTQVVDRFFISIGFESDELRASPHRGWLYFGIFYSLGLICAFSFAVFMS